MKKEGHVNETATLIASSVDLSVMNRNESFINTASKLLERVKQQQQQQHQHPNQYQHHQQAH